MSGALFITALSCAVPVSLAAQQDQFRVVIGTNVACRAEPQTSAPVARRYDPGDVIVPRNQSATEDGVWYWQEIARFPGGTRGCWIHGSLTADWSDRQRALLAAADRILGMTERAALEDYVAIDNLLSQTPLRVHSDSTVLQASPLLQLRRLQILQRAADAAQTRNLRRDPLLHAWFLARRGELRYHEPWGSWMLSADVYWRLYEEQRGTPSAEEIAWAAARGDVPGDECYAVCWLEGLRQTYARYWSEFPQGRWVADALREAIRQSDSALEAGCLYATPEEAQASVASLRQSLTSVIEPGKDQFLARLREIERICQT